MNYYTFTLGVQKSKELPSELSVGHSFLDKFLLLSQLLRAEVLHLSGHPVVVVQQRQESSIGRLGKESVLVDVAEQAESTNDYTEMKKRLRILKNGHMTRKCCDDKTVFSRL